MAAPSRYRQRKDSNQTEIVDALEAIGCDVIVMHSPCDLLVGYRGLNLLLEVKRDHRPSRITPAQRKWNEGWRGQRLTVTTPQEAIEGVLAAVV